MKKRICCIVSFLFVFVFVFSGCQKEVIDFKYTLNINSKTYEGAFSGTVDKGIPADGQGVFLSGTEGSGKYYSYDGEWKEGIPSGTGRLTDENFEVELPGSEKKPGTYSGEAFDGIPNGTGTFQSNNQTDGKWNYEGEWKNGKPAGKGTLTDENFEIDLSGSKRDGVYTGDVMDGIPNGNGKFSTQNSNGKKYYYEGEWKNGKWNGQGKVVFEDKTLGVQEGTYTDNSFTPTLVERIQELGTYEDDCCYTLSEAEKQFIEDNAEIIEGKNLQGLSTKVDSSFKVEQFKKNSNSFSPAFVKMSNTSIVQISEYEGYNGQTLTFCIASSEDYETNLYLYMIGSAKDAVENSTADIYFLPLEYTTYKNVSNSDVWAIAGVAVKIDVK